MATIDELHTQSVNTDLSGLKQALIKALRTGAEFVSPPADGPGAAAVAGIRSLLPGRGNFSQEFDRYNRAAAPSPLYSHPSRFGSVVKAPGQTGMSQGEQAQSQAMAMQTALIAALKGPPMDPRQYRNMADIEKTYRSQYVKDGKVVQSSREVPYTGEVPEVGTWAVDDLKGLHGREVAQLRKLDPKDLLVSEDVRAEGRLGDAERYAQWMREGRTPPPIRVVETDKGGLRVTDGHRRLEAAKQAGQEVPAWVWPAMDHPESLIDSSTGKPMRVGMTLEGTLAEAIRAANKKGAANK